MRAILQRVSEASVTVEGNELSAINKGLLVLLGVEDTDSQEDLEWLVNKISRLRIFNDNNGVMNLSLLDIDGDVIVVSQFTLFAAVKKGNRPSYLRASKGEISEPIYNKFVERMSKEIGKNVQKGVFGADMKVKLLNEGPVTIFIDTKNKE